MAKILLTGGGGFIGSHLAEGLLSQHDEVTIADLDIMSNVSQLDCAKTRIDVRSPGALDPCLREKDVIIHLAAVSRVEWGQQHPFDCFQTNVVGTLNVLEGIKARGIHPLFVLVSSREVYGEPKQLPVREADQKNPISIYGSSKLSAEWLVKTYCQHFEIPFVIVRLSNAYGSRRDQPGRVIPSFVRAALASFPLVVNGGEQCLDFTYVDDIVRGLIVLVRQFLNGNQGTIREDLHFVTGKGINVIDLANLIREVCNSKSEIVRKEGRAFDVRNFVGDPSKANQLLGIRLTTDLRDGLVNYVGELRSWESWPLRNE